MGEKTYRRIASVATAMGVLRWLAENGGAVSGADVAAGVGEAYPKVMCHLATLEDEGWVERVGEYWALGMESARLWSRYKARMMSTIDEAKSKLQKISIGE